MRARLIGIGIVAMLLAVLVQLRTDASLNANLEPLVSAHPTLSVTPVVRNPEIFFARPLSTKGELIAYDMATARQSFKLTRGLPSADWSHYFAASAAPDDTIIETHALSSGSLEHSFTLGGTWNLESVSASGRWLALSRLLTDREMINLRKEKRWKTDFEIVEASEGSVAHSVLLDGNFQADAVSDDSLFLTQYLPATDPAGFVIRVYDLTSGALLPQPLGEKPSGEVMAGDVLQRVLTPDGTHLVTLYLGASDKSAFIQTLDLTNRNLVHIDLPSAIGNPTQLKEYSLALSPDGRNVYAVNPALGVLVEVSLEDRSIVRTVQFTPHKETDAADSQSNMQTGTSIVSGDGKRLFFASLRDIWTYDTIKGNVDHRYSLNEPILGLGLNDSGDRLYAATGTGPAREFIVVSDGWLAPLN